MGLLHVPSEIYKADASTPSLDGPAACFAQDRQDRMYSTSSLDGPVACFAQDMQDKSFHSLARWVGYMFRPRYAIQNLFSFPTCLLFEISGLASGRSTRHPHRVAQPAIPFKMPAQTLLSVVISASSPAVLFRCTIICHT